MLYDLCKLNAHLSLSILRYPQNYFEAIKKQEVHHHVGQLSFCIFQPKNTHPFLHKI